MVGCDTLSVRPVEFSQNSSISLGVSQHLTTTIKYWSGSKNELKGSQRFSQPPKMAFESRPSTSFTSATTSYSTGASYRPGKPRVPRSSRPKTSASSIAGDQQIICAVSESRGISPLVGLAFVNVSTAEASLCQISDNQTFARTIQKLQVYDPTEILIMNTAANPKSRLLSLVESCLQSKITFLERKFWAELTGLEYIQQLAFKQDVEAIKICLDDNYYATCCLAAVSVRARVLMAFLSHCPPCFAAVFLFPESLILLQVIFEHGGRH